VTRPTQAARRITSRAKPVDAGRSGVAAGGSLGADDEIDRAAGEVMAAVAPPF
jgi:hypothetical protein